MPSPHFNNPSMPHAMNQLDTPGGAEQPLRHPMSSPHMHQQQYMTPSPHHAPARARAQRPHASEFMDPNARLKEEENSKQSADASRPPSAGGREEPSLPPNRKWGDAHAPRTHVISIAVPLGWKRVVEAGTVVYYRYESF